MLNYECICKSSIFFSFFIKEQNVIVRPDKSRDVVQSRNLLSKFLYHSIEGNVKQTTPEQEGGESPVSVKAVSLGFFMLHKKKRQKQIP